MKIFIKAAILVLLAASLLYANAKPRMEDIAGKLACYCGTCPNLVVSVCTCGTADEIKVDIQKMIDSGLSEEQIIDSYVAKYGQTVLAAPPKSGFSLTAWAVPIFAFAGGVAVLIGFLKRQNAHREEPASPVQSTPTIDEQDSYYRDQLEKELEKQS